MKKRDSLKASSLDGAVEIKQYMMIARNLFNSLILFLVLAGCSQTGKTAVDDTNSTQINVIPLPYNSVKTMGESNLVLSNNVGIDAPKEMESMIDVFIDDLSADGFSGFTKSPGGIIKIKIDSKLPKDAAPKALGKTPDETVTDERYSLEINKKEILITSPTAVGAYRGLTTLRQLMMTSEKSHEGKIILEPIKITDGPKLGWRGFKMDVARNYYSPNTVKEVINQLALYKYNILTLHLTDNEAWRIEIKGHPKLTSNTEKYYTQNELKSIVEYAKNHGITVIPEIDFPGHSAAIIKIYPDVGELKEIAGKNIAYVEPVSTRFWEIFDDVAGELKEMTRSQFLHFGGDEAFGMPDPLYHQFIEEALKRTHRLGMTPIGYQEASRAGVAPGDYIQIWADFADPGGDLEKWKELVKEGKPLPQGMPAEAIGFYEKAGLDLGQALKQKAVIIASPTKRAYFDTPYAESSSDPNQENTRSSLGMTLYTPLTLEQFYNWKPANILYGLPLENLGGVEAAIWADTIRDDKTLWQLILARIPGFAEKAWSSQDNLSWENYQKRLAHQSINWRTRNLEWFQSSLVDWK